ncbi:unnamed protein product [Citrullus colocynthis]|uniref:Uncharacterized protein n=1 Tax=Citrullus colocynthis TaxID=252529 RepID=A0ABP0XVQ2_9ROSI
MCKISQAVVELLQVAIVIPVGSDLSLKRSLFKVLNSERFSFSISLPGSYYTSLNLNLRSTRARGWQTVCMSVQQASAPKVSIAPLDLEDAKEPPLNLYKPKEPYTATIVSVERLVGSKAPGKSYGVIPPGENPKKPWSPHSVCLCSIASARCGDSFDGQTASLCVRRAVYYDPETGKEDPSKKGICNNFLCNSESGDKVQIIGKLIAYCPENKI